jgi:4-amino-4-deoxy-L-arabinose transferase-like glycosyltransferase
VAALREGKILWDVVALGVWCLVALTLVNAGLSRMWFHAQFALMAVGIGLIWWGVCGRTILSNRQAVGAIYVSSVLRKREESRTHRLALVTLAAITLLALVLRVWKLESAVHVFADEMAFTDAVVHLWDEPFDEVLRPFDPVASFTSLYPYLQYWTEKITGPGLLALRLPSAILGTLTIPVLYLLAVSLFDRKTALLAAFALAVFPPHIHTSRSALNNVADPFFGTLALALLAYGLNSRRRMDFVLAGFALGLTQYFYEGGRVIFLLVTLAWLALMAAPQHISTLWSPDTRWLRRNMLLFALAAFCVAAPVYVALRSNDYSITPRYDWHGNGDTAWLALKRNGLFHYFRFYLRPPLLHFIRTPDGSQFFYGGETPLVLAFMLPAFITSCCAYCAAGRRRVDGACCWLHCGAARRYWATACLPRPIGRRVLPFFSRRLRS